MKFFALIVLALSPCLLGAAPARSYEFCGPTPTVDETRVRAYLATRQIVMVHGYWGGKFDDNREAVRKIDACVPVTAINPEWRASVEKNAEALLERLKKISAENFGNEILLLGHSKGGAEVLQLAVTHPEIFERGNPHGFTVAAVVPVQAAIGGSALADLELARDPAHAARWEKFREKHDVGDSFVARLLKNAFLGSSSDGFRALATRESAERNARLLATYAAHPAAIRALLNRKIVYVTAMRDARNEEDLPFYMKKLALFLAEGGEPNDGLLDLWSQTLPGVGRELFRVRNAAHFSLVAHLESSRCREEFTRALLDEISRPAEGVIPNFPK